jgi:hypothetical protein
MNGAPKGAPYAYYAYYRVRARFNKETNTKYDKCCGCVTRFSFRDFGVFRGEWFS